MAYKARRKSSASRRKAPVNRARRRVRSSGRAGTSRRAVQTVRIVVEQSPAGAASGGPEAMIEQALRSSASKPRRSRF